MPDNPYAALGLPADATPEQIREAHRRLAKETHPDAGGDADRFTAVQQAYEILSDEDRRAHYDTTGETEKTDTEKQAITLATNAFKAAFGGGERIKTEDLIEAAQQHIRERKRECENIALQSKNNAEKYREALGRLTSKGGHFFIQAAIEGQVAACEAVVQQAGEQVEIAKRAGDMLKEYEYRKDEPEPAIEDELAGWFRGAIEVARFRFNFSNTGEPRNVIL